MEELSEAKNLSKVLRFRQPDQDNREFVIDDIEDPTATTKTTVVRFRSDRDGPDKRKLQDKEDWEEWFAKIFQTFEGEVSKSNLTPYPNPSPRLVLVIARPDAENGLRTEMDTAGSIKECEPIDTTAHSGRVSGSQSVIDRIRAVVMAAASFLAQPGGMPPTGKNFGASSAENLTRLVSATPRVDQRKRLRHMPFTLETFRLIAKRMSLHSWIVRLISRANMPAFERTVTEMPLYSNAGRDLEGQKAIIYNCRTSNEWEDDMALTVTHFPNQKLSFAVLFGASVEQEKSVISRLKKAGADTVHPMLLPGILAEMERIRQMAVVEEGIGEMETKIFQLDNETVATWKRSGQTKAERNREKTKAWLDLNFSRNLLQATATLLLIMRKHLDEFPLLVNHYSMRRYYRLRHQELGLYEHHVQNAARPSSPQFLGSMTNSWTLHDHKPYSSEYFPESKTLTSEPETIYDPDAKYQDLLQQASMRMADRLVVMIGEYDDKIRACTMEVDGIAMATQWSHGETSMEIATASGEDSSHMRSIALVTMVFLPGTFFASMFSMSFFNWTPDSGGDSPIVSGKIWIYFVITVFFTLLTIYLFWYFILSRQRNRRLRQRDSCPV
ncbi:hypothetical protein MFIFM68171_06579 [Madurella fahalii]|uniref:Uncharacterized protein n=1 Tax=Madurella fahalii TaxID=1157608 RepID=A0ABQ0GF54_9PEZI